ncbi:hypothetical protein [Coleofasciculus sp.]|uniref:hypothetical protein n=1 Tax=Coleofasciculus sp. TaxID=3100458 RepID=UPI0039F99B44
MLTDFSVAIAGVRFQVSDWRNRSDHIPGSVLGRVKAKSALKSWSGHRKAVQVLIETLCFYYARRIRKLWIPLNPYQEFQFYTSIMYDGLENFGFP